MSNIKHGMKGTKIYDRWVDMKRRCNNPNNNHYKNYGGRGITVCDEWQHDFKTFYNWAIANGYSEKLELDRKDNSKGYSPDNCRFVTSKVNNSNKRNNHSITINGKTKTATEWAEAYGLERHMLLQRLKLGWIGEDLLKPAYSAHSIIINDKFITLAELARQTGIKQITLWARYKKGWTGDKLIQPLLRSHPVQK